MACFHPVDAWRKQSGEIIFADRGDCAWLQLPCGHCIGCRLERSRMWAARCVHEASLHEFNSFVTLTYSSDFLPQNGSLLYSDFQAFMRRLRKCVGPVRFYMCGEYGDINGRPHFHACLFGVHFHDREFLRSLPSGSSIYRSALLERLWRFGYSSIGDVTFESAAYVARYITKKITGDLARTHYSRVDPDSGEIYHISPEFSRMSLKPGIGARWFEKWSADAFPHDYVVINGVKCKPPKYYKALLKRRDGFVSDDVDFARSQAALDPRRVADSTPDRLAVREHVAAAQLKVKKRGLEY